MQWKSVVGFPDYEVSEAGDVRRRSTGRSLKLYHQDGGYPTVTLMRGGERHTRGLARIVALAFLPSPRNIDAPTHLDGDKSNCDVDNLVWRSRWYAIRYHQQFPFEDPMVEGHVQDLDSGYIYENSIKAAIANGLVERELVLTALNEEPAWPTNQFFRIIS